MRRLCFRLLLGDTVDIAAAQQNFSGGNGNDRPVRELGRQNFTGSLVHGGAELRNQNAVIGNVKVDIGGSQPFACGSGGFAVPEV